MDTFLQRAYHLEAPQVKKDARIGFAESEVYLAFLLSLFLKSCL